MAQQQHASSTPGELEDTRMAAPGTAPVQQQGTFIWNVMEHAVAGAVASGVQSSEQRK
jgi:hypothetical protein